MVRLVLLMTLNHVVRNLHRVLMLKPATLRLAQPSEALFYAIAKQLRQASPPRGAS